MTFTDPEDVLSLAQMAAEGFGWLNEIFVSIEREVEAGNSVLRIAKLAAAGAYLADDIGSYCGAEHETMRQKLQVAGILSPDRWAPD